MPSDFLMAWSCSGLVFWMQGNSAAFEEGRARLQALYKDAGWIKEDGSILSTGNLVNLITASKK